MKSMKNLVFIALLFIGFATQAQEDAEFKKETVEFIKLTGAGSAFENAIDQIGAMVSEENKAKYTTEALATLDGLYNKMADLYMVEFTKDDIKNLMAFYKTDLGKKLADKQLGLMQKAMAFGQTWGLEVQAIAQKYQ